MVAPAALMKFVIGGSLAQTEEWSCSMHFDAPNADADTAGVVSFVNALGAYFPSNAKAEFYKWNEVAPSTGMYADPNNSRTVAINVTPGGAIPLPPQCALVLSLLTDNARGPAHAGRIYLPFQGSDNVGADGRITAAARDSLLTAGRSAINLLQTALGGSLIVWSQQYQTFHPVTAVGLGRVVDTQRRRRKSLLEVPAVLAL